MYLHTGSHTLTARDIVGIFDMDTATVGAATKEFVRRAQNEGELRVCDELPKTFILTAPRDRGGVAVTLSPFAPAALLRRVRGAQRRAK